MTKIIYRSRVIEVDKDECGTDVVYVYLFDGGDPLEIIGGSVERAKGVIDQCIRDLEEANGPDDDDEWVGISRDPDRERFGADY